MKINLFWTQIIKKQLRREKFYAKLKEDFKIKWHRDEYNKG